MRRRILVLGMAVALAASSCSSGRATAHPPPSLAGPNPDVIPAVITPAYVDAVFKVLNHINSDAARLMASEHFVTPAAQAELRAIFNNPVYSSQVRAANLSIQQGVISNVNPAGGDSITTVLDLVTATRDCLFVETKTDLSALLISVTPEPASEYYQLTPKQRGNDPERLNSTPWAISFNAAFQTPTALPSKCGV